MFLHIYLDSSHTPYRYLPYLLLLFSITLSTNSLAEGNTADHITIDVESLNHLHTDDLNGLIKQRNIRILTVYSKTFYSVNQEEFSGMIYELSRMFENFLNQKLHAAKKLPKNIKVHVTLIPVGRDELLPALIEGRGDIAAANLTITRKRLETVDFSEPFYPDVMEVLVSGPMGNTLTSAEELSGELVFVRKSSSYYESLVALNEKLKAAGKNPVKIQPAPEELEDEDILDMVNAGLIPYTIVDDYIANLWQQVYVDIMIQKNVTVREHGSIGWAVRKNNPQLKSLVNLFAKQHRKGTKEGNMMISRYLKSAGYLNNATSRSEKKKLNSLSKYFKEYGTRYNVDWLLMAAQGYQESRLEQSVRSPSGAVGIMQLLPSTGKQMNVGDITKIKANIHAGTKYMRWTIDQYYLDEPMSDLNKVLFAFASYNAGPRRIRELRTEAKRRGLNPDVWFQNVEYVAAEKIGAETVTYVSNIFKYYVAYSLILENQEGKPTVIRQSAFYFMPPNDDALLPLGNPWNGMARKVSDALRVSRRDDPDAA